MPTRYNKARTITNSSEYHEPLRESRGGKDIVHYGTQPLKNPTVAERATVKTTRHVWGYGDRLYNLAHKYYGDQRYWWVIAWWNGVALEADLTNGSLIYIPLSLERVIAILEV